MTFRWSDDLERGLIHSDIRDTAEDVGRLECRPTVDEVSRALAPR
jgi:hypothetical protein